jgi:hypothetical protein
MGEAARSSVNNSRAHSFLEQKPVVDERLARDVLLAEEISKKHDQLNEQEGDERRHEWLADENVKAAPRLHTHA